MFRTTAFSFCLAIGAMTGTAAAQSCDMSNTGAKCIAAVSAGTAAPLVAPGDTLPPRYYVLLNTEYFGLPPASDGWLYFEVERRIFRVESRTRRVIDDVTHLANAAF